MDAKVYLQMLRESVEHLPILWAKKRIALEHATNAVAGAGDGPVVSSNISNIPEAYAIQVERYDRDIEKTEQMIRRTSEMVEKIKDPFSQSIIDLYYINAEPWWHVALTIQRNYNYTCGELHSKAIKDFEEIFSEPEIN